MSDPSVILLVEDRQDDVLLVQRALARAKILNPLFVVHSGEEAISYLSGDGKFSNRAEYPLPELILLDLKMPGLDGFDVLKWVRSQAAFKPLRIVVLTSSEEVYDVDQAYGLGANSFLVKPYDFTDLVSLAQVLQKFWLHLSRTPETFRLPKPDNHPMDIPPTSM